MDVAVGADVGGTFTDLVAYDGTRVRGWKTPTTPIQSDAVVDGLSRCEIDTDTAFLHGTTVATNALLEGTGSRVVLVTTEGFEDLVEIGRQKRPSLYDNAVDRPRPLVHHDDRVGYQTATAVLEFITRAAPEAVAVVLLGSYLDPQNELDLARQLIEAFPDLPVSVGAELSPGFREFERISTTVLNAYLTPVTARYLNDMNQRVEMMRADVMTSAGGVLPFAVASRAVGQLTLSGPAAGVVAADALKTFHQVDSAVSFDMGGTSTDVCRIGPDGVDLAPLQVLDERVNRVPSMPIRTVGAGGGSVAWSDAGGSLRVGPRSAGADPGPACYGRGGLEPTVTDANLLLGYVQPSARFAGGLEMSFELAFTALSALGQSLGLTALETARGVIEVVDAHMERVIRSVSVEEGFDPRGASLIAFGGAGGLHATRLARALNMESVLIPPLSGVFSAFGLMLARPRVEVLATILTTSAEEAAEPMASLRKQALEKYRSVYGVDPTVVDESVDVRYAGQSHEVMIPYRAGRVRDDFADEHLGRFGFVLEGAEVELVNGRAVAVGEPPLTWEALGSPEEATSPVSEPVEIVVNGRSTAAESWTRADLPVGFALPGPALIADGSSSTLLNPEDRLVVLSDGTLEITW